MFSPLSRESALIVNNIFLCSIAAVVFTGTLYPPFANLLFGVQLSVGAPFFNQTVLPLTAPLIIAMAIGPLLPWKRAALRPALERIWVAALIALVVFVVMTGETNAITALGLAGGVWVILSAVFDIAERIKFLRVPLADSLARLFALPRAAFGAALGHAGFGVMVCGIAGMTLAAQKVIILSPGQSTTMAGYTWTLDSLHDAPGPNYAARIADVTISSGGKPFLTLHPSRRVFVNPAGVTTNDAAIHTNGFQDIYVVFAAEQNGGAELRLNRHPLAPEIWFGGLIMALGGALSLSDRRLRIGAPARAAKKTKTVAA
jgi:cytochrome c-type biogenesis protein CcmF